MQVSVEVGEGLERRLKIELPFAQMAAEIDKQFQQLARTAALPGFRPGRVPMKILQKRFLDRVRMDAFSDLVQSSYQAALKQEALIPAGMPNIEPDIDFAAERIGYTATFEVMPEFELATLTDKTLKRPVCELTDADLETMLWKLRKKRGSWSEVERPCQIGDRVVISIVATIDGVVDADESTNDTTIELGGKAMPPGFDEALCGATKGEQRHIDLVIPDDYEEDNELNGKAVNYAVTLHAVTELTAPELDAEFVAEFGITDGDIDHFRADVRANMERELAQRLAAHLKTAVLDLLLDAHPILLPRALVDDEINEMHSNFIKQLGFPANLPADFFVEKAQRRVALGLILNKFIAEHELKIDAAQVREKVEQMASTYEQPQAVIDHYYSQRERLDTVKSVLLEEAAVALVVKQANIEDEVLSFAELMAVAH
jgi:trigger factor